MEGDIYEIITILLESAYGVDYTSINVPNKYLNA